MKKMLINLGGVIATFLMFSPIVVLSMYSNFETYEFLFLLIVTICYDFYIYSIIDKNNKMEYEKKHYYQFVKDIDKKIKLNISNEEKIKNLENYIEKLINNYFN